MVGLFPGVDTAVPGDLLPVLGAVGTVRALVEPGAPVPFHMVIEHQLVAAGKVTEGAAQRGLTRVPLPGRGCRCLGSLLVLLQVVLHQAHPLPGSKVTELAAVAEMLLPPVLIQCRPAGEGLLAGPTLEPGVLLPGVPPQTGGAGAQQPAVGAVQGALGGLRRRARGGQRGLRMPAQRVLLERRLGAELGLALTAGKSRGALVAAVDVAGDVMAEVAAVVTEGTEVGRRFVVHPQPVQAQFGVGTERLRTGVAADAANPCVSGLVGLKPVPSGGGEVAEGALMWLHPLVLQPSVLLQAPALLTGEAAVPALQRGPGGSGWGRGSGGVPALLVEPQGGSSGSSEGAEAAAQLSRGLQGAAPGLVSPQSPLLLAAKGTRGAREAGRLLLWQQGRLPIPRAALYTPTAQGCRIPAAQRGQGRLGLDGPSLSSPASTPAALSHMRGDGGEARAEERA